MVVHGTPGDLNSTPNQKPPRDLVPLPFRFPLTSCIRLKMGRGQDVDPSGGEPTVVFTIVGSETLASIRKMLSCFYAIPEIPARPRASVGKTGDSTRFDQAKNAFTRFDEKAVVPYAHPRKNRGFGSSSTVITLSVQLPQCASAKCGSRLHKYNCGYKDPAENPLWTQGTLTLPSTSAPAAA